MLRKHFIDNSAFQTHIKSKPHKRRLHALKETTILNFLGRGVGWRHLKIFCRRIENSWFKKKNYIFANGNIYKQVILNQSLIWKTKYLSKHCTSEFWPFLAFPIFSVIANLILIFEVLKFLTPPPSPHNFRWGRGLVKYRVSTSLHPPAPQQRKCCVD